MAQQYGYEDLHWKDKLSFFQSNPDAAQADLTRSTNLANLYKAQNNMDAYNKATNWINQINTAVGTPQQTTPQQNNISDLTSQLLKKLNEPPKEFNYNLHGDPQYAAAMSRAHQNAQQGSNMNMAEMNRRGILNSTITSDRGAEIQQRELGRVESEIVPQLIQQAYQQYLGQQDQQQRQFQNMSSMLGQLSGQDQQYLDNQYRDRAFDRGMLESDRNYDRSVLESDRNYNRGIEESDREFEYRAARDAITDERWKVQFDEDVRRYGIDSALQRQVQLGNLDISRMNANTSAQSAAQSASNAQINQLMDVWRATGQAPAGIPNVAQGTPYGQQQSTKMSPSDYKTNPEFASDYSYIVNNPEKAGKVLIDNAEAFIQTYGFDGYRALISGLPKEDQTAAERILMSLMEGG